LTLVLLAVFGLAAALVSLPDLHPQRLHAISEPFQKDIRTCGIIYMLFIGYSARGTLAEAAPAAGSSTPSILSR
jgi:hypothetical protein